MVREISGYSGKYISERDTRFFVYYYVIEKSYLKFVFANIILLFQNEKLSFIINSTLQ